MVINAIDDRLASAQQIRDDWTINRISPLGSLLKLARDSGRVVILASDHGHVWHRSDARNVPIETGGGGVRRVRTWPRTRSSWRAAGSGGRAATIIVPWSERVYYGQQQNGYHGGATPQEMVCPLVLLTDRSSRLLRVVPLRVPQAGLVVVGPGQDLCQRSSGAGTAE